MTLLSCTSVRLPCRFSPSGPAIRPGAFRCALLLNLLVWLLPLFVSAQQFSFRHYDQQAGLRNLDVFSMVEDVEGALVMATENGLFRYDGSGFEHIGPDHGLAEQLSLALYKEPGGTVWVTTHDHLYRLEGTRAIAVPLGDTEALFTPGQTMATPSPGSLLLLARGKMRRLTRTAGDKWIAAPYLAQSALAAHPELANVHSLYVTRDGVLWMGCGQAICRIAKARDVEHPHADDVEVFAESRGVPAQVWRQFFQSADGALWIRSFDAIRLLPLGESTFRDRPMPNGLTPYRGSGLIALAEDHEGRVITQTDHGLARWESNGWRIFDQSNGIVVKDVSTILRDRTNHLWFATRGHGIFRWLGYGNVESWTSAQGMADDVAWPIFRDSRNRLWLSDQFQVGLLDEQTHRVAPPPAFTHAPFAHATGFAEARDGSLWFLRIGGEAVRTDPDVRRINFRATLPVLSLNLTDSAGQLWIASRSGLFVIRYPAAHKPVVEEIRDPAVSGDAFADIAESPDHTLWFLADRHLVQLRNGVYRRIPLDEAATRGQMRGIAAAADGTLWIGGGIPALLHIAVQDGHSRILESITPPAIASNVVQIVRFDGLGHLWIGTDLGVNIFDGKAWRSVSDRDGIVSNDTDEGAFFADRDGSVWFGVNGGSVHILHPEHYFADQPLDARITSATFAGQPLEHTGRVVLPWQDAAAFDAEFTSFNLASDASLRFRYRLKGLESGWSETSQHRLHYPALGPGSYQLEVRAIDPDRQRVSPIATFRFAIRPPWWRTWPFYLLMLLLSFAGCVLLWNWRERRLIAQQRKLRHLVALRTRELEAEKAELVAAREALRHQATRDALTGQWNRSAILDILRNEIERAHRSGAPLAIVLADIDHFKLINDTYGHLSGDTVLRAAAQRMHSNIRPYDYLGRYGGEEFLFVFPGLPWQDPHARLHQLKWSLAEEPFAIDHHSLSVTSSFGVAWLDPTILSVEDLIRRADTALYRAKASGRDCIVFYDEDPLREAILNTKL